MEQVSVRHTSNNRDLGRAEFADLLDQNWFQIDPTPPAPEETDLFVELQAESDKSLELMLEQINSKYGSNLEEESTEFQIFNLGLEKIIDHVAGRDLDTSNRSHCPRATEELFKEIIDGLKAQLNPIDVLDAMFDTYEIFIGPNPTNPVYRVFNAKDTYVGDLIMDTSRHQTIIIKGELNPGGSSNHFSPGNKVIIALNPPMTNDSIDNLSNKLNPGESINDLHLDPHRNVGSVYQTPYSTHKFQNPDVLSLSEWEAKYGKYDWQNTFKEHFRDWDQCGPGDGFGDAPLGVGVNQEGGARQSSSNNIEVESEWSGWAIPTGVALAAAAVGLVGYYVWNNRTKLQQLSV